MSLVRAICNDLRLGDEYVSAIADSASFRYKRFELRKRSGGTRVILHPSRELKSLQYWIHRNILSRLRVHSAAIAYRPGQNIRHNAATHAGAHFLLRLDFINFFPSLASADVVHVLEANAASLPPAWTNDDSHVLAKIVCRFGRLTIGAVTSPALSNAMCYDLDVKMQELARNAAVIYTRYADDMFFSARTPDVLASLEPRIATAIKTLVCPSDLRLNPAKRFNSSRKRRMMATGLVLTPTGDVSLGRATKRRIRALIHKQHHLSEIERDRLAGILAYCKSVEPYFMNRLILKYGAEEIHAARLGSRWGTNRAK